MITKSYEKLIEYLALISGLLVFVMSVLTTGDILGRSIITTGIPGCYELVQYLMVFVVFFAMAYVQSQKGNVRVELLLTHFYASGIYSWESWVARESMHDLQGGPLYIWKFGVPFGCVFMCAELVVGIVKTIRQSIGAD